MWFFFVGVLWFVAHGPLEEELTPACDANDPVGFLLVCGFLFSVAPHFTALLLHPPDWITVFYRKVCVWRTRPVHKTDT